MQAAFITLTPAAHSNGYGVVEELHVAPMAITQMGVADGFTFVETSAGCSWVVETPMEVFAKIQEIFAAMNGYIDPEDLNLG